MTFSRYAISALVLALAACGADAETARERAPDDADGWQVKPDADVVAGDASRDSSATDPADAEPIDAIQVDAVPDAEPEPELEPAENDASEPTADGGDVTGDAAAYPNAKVLWAYSRRETKHVVQDDISEARAEIAIYNAGHPRCSYTESTEWYVVGSGEATTVIEIETGGVDCLMAANCDVPITIRWGYKGPGGFDLYNPRCGCHWGVEYPSDPVPVEGECHVPDLAAAGHLAWRHTVHQLDAEAVDETWELVDLDPTL